MQNPSLFIGITKSWKVVRDYVHKRVKQNAARTAGNVAVHGIGDKHSAGSKQAASRNGSRGGKSFGGKSFGGASRATRRASQAAAYGYEERRRALQRVVVDTILAARPEPGGFANCQNAPVGSFERYVARELYYHMREALLRIGDGEGAGGEDSGEDSGEGEPISTRKEAKKSSSSGGGGGGGKIGGARVRTSSEETTGDEAEGEGEAEGEAEGEGDRQDATPDATPEGEGVNEEAWNGGEEKEEGRTEHEGDDGTEGADTEEAGALELELEAPPDAWLVHRDTVIKANAATAFGSERLAALAEAREARGDLVRAARATWAASL